MSDLVKLFMTLPELGQWAIAALGGILCAYVTHRLLGVPSPERDKSESTER